MSEISHFCSFSQNKMFTSSYFRFECRLREACFKAAWLAASLIYTSKKVPRVCGGWVQFPDIVVYSVPRICKEYFFIYKAIQLWTVIILCKILVNPKNKVRSSLSLMKGPEIISCLYFYLMFRGYVCERRYYIIWDSILICSNSQWISSSISIFASFVLTQQCLFMIPL